MISQGRLRFRHNALFEVYLRLFQATAAVVGTALIVLPPFLLIAVFFAA